MQRFWLAMAFAFGFGAMARSARAQQDCPNPITREALPGCALAHSLAIQREARTRDALVGRRTAANPLVPSNPVVSGAIGRRSADAIGGVVNWSVQLGQEIELGGQRGLRLKAADSDLLAEAEQTIVVQREVIADAFDSYFAVLGAHAELELAQRLEAVARAVSTTTATMAEHGVVSGVDSEVADAVATRAIRARLEAEGRLSSERIALATALGFDPSTATFDATGPLTPLASVDTAARAGLHEERPEVRALQYDSAAWEARSRTFSRSRIPNITISTFVQDDGFHEQVFGWGLSLPIPLPQPLGRTYNGEVVEAQAIAERSKNEAARTRNVLTSDVLRALARFDATVQARDSVSQARLDHAEQTLQTIASEVSAGRLAIRDAVVAQQTLVDLLLDGSRARVAVCLASVEVARAASLPLERGGL